MVTCPFLSLKGQEQKLSQLKTTKDSYNNNNNNNNNNVEE